MTATTSEENIKNILESWNIANLPAFKGVTVTTEDGQKKYITFRSIDGRGSEMLTLAVYYYKGSISKLYFITGQYQSERLTEGKVTLEELVENK